MKLLTLAALAATTAAHRCEQREREREKRGERCTRLCFEDDVHPPRTLPPSLPLHPTSNLIHPKPRNAVDSNLPQWHGGLSPDKWQPYGDNPCACRNGSDVCDVGQTCLWMSVGCSIGCKTCDGGTIDGKSVGTNPNALDRCEGGAKPTNNDPLHRTFNRNCTGDCIGTRDDFTRYNPWRAPGSAPVYDSCGRAGGGPHPTGGHGEYINTSNAQFGDMGSNLPYLDSGVVWEAGSTVETMWSVRANHGGGFQYRLCPVGSALTEECFQKTPMPFAVRLGHTFIGRWSVLHLCS